MKYWSTFKKIGLPLFVLTVLGTSLDQWITLHMETLLMSSEGMSPWIWLYGALSLVLNLTYPLLGILLILSTVQPASPVNFLQRNFVQNLIEEMRAWGKAMAWSVLFILPGLWRFLQYFFVPFVVSLDPDYQKGEKDALAEARQLSKGRMLHLFMLFVAFSVVTPGLITLFDEWRLVWKTPFGALMICFVEMLLNLWFIQILFKMYQKGVAHESHVSMERH